MDNYKILDVLRTLDKKELRRFGDFISSPYFNKNKNVIRLFNSLTKFHPVYNHKNLTLEKLFVKVFLNDKFDYHKISNIISDLYKLSEKYIVQMQVEQKEFYIERNFLRGLRNRRLYKIYEVIYSSYIKKLIDRKYKDEDYFFNLYELNDEYLWYATIKKPNTELNILQTEFDHFICYVLIRLLRFYNLMLHEKSQNYVDYKMTLLDEVMSLLQKTEYDNPSIKIFKTTLLLLKTKDVKHYNDLWRLKEKHFDEFKFDDQYLLFVHLYDYAAYMVNFIGDDDYNKDMFRIYREMIECEFMTPGSFLYPNIMNIIKISCRVGELEYAEKILEMFKDHFPPDEKLSILNFCYGIIENAKGNFPVALTHFSKTNFKNFIFKVQVKILLLKIYYKLSMFEDARNMIDTFKHFISREKNLIDEHRQSYNLFLNLLSMLIKAMESPDKSNLSFVREKIRKQLDTMPTNPFRIKIWLLEEVTKRG